MKKFPLFASLLFTFMSLISCGGDSGGGGSKLAPAPVPAAEVPQEEEEPFEPGRGISGTLTYDYVPPTDNGLDYDNIIRKPIRRVSVEAVNPIDDRVVGTSVTRLDGQYKIKIPDSVGGVYLRILSEVKSPSIEVQDNTNVDAIYAAESEPVVVGDEGAQLDLNVPSGWTGSKVTGSYSSPRASAPFAILDAALSAARKVRATDESIKLPALKINWSVNNITTFGDKNIGQIGTSHYSQTNNELYILGKEDVDTDEFDSHIIVHEWGHYFENRLGRSDSVNGPHGMGELIDMTIAFGEGWGNALSGMVLDPQVSYRDTAGSRQGVIINSFSLESSPDPEPGWFSEASVQKILFDLYDANNDPGDTISGGMKPIIDVMTTHQVQTSARTSIFSFLNGYKNKNPASSSQVDSLSVASQIGPVQDDYGSGETNDGGNPVHLPVYHPLAEGQTSSTALLGPGARMNEMYNNRYFRFKANSIRTMLSWQATGRYAFEVYEDEKRIFSEESDSEHGPRGDVINTTPGKEYVARVFTDENASSVVYFDLLMESI